jgi:hypothetical protein
LHASFKRSTSLKLLIDWLAFSYSTSNPYARAAARASVVLPSPGLPVKYTLL